MDERPIGPVGQDFRAATEMLRSTAKWLVAVAAALGSVLIAGTQVSDIGELPKDEARFWVAAGSLTCALAGVGFVIVFARRVLVAGPVSLREVMVRLSDGPPRAAEELDPSSLRFAVIEEAAALYQSVASHEGATDTRDGRSGLSLLWWLVDRQAVCRFKSAEFSPFEPADSPSRIDVAAANVVSFVDNWETRRRFRDLTRCLGVAGCVVPTAIVAFTLAVRHVDLPAPTVEAPVDVVVHLSSSARESLADQRNCPVPEDLPAIAIAGTWLHPVLVVPGDAPCDPIRLTPDDESVVIPLTESSGG